MNIRDVKVIIEEKIAFKNHLEGLLRSGWQLLPGSFGVAGVEYIPEATPLSPARTDSQGAGRVLVGFAIVYQEEIREDLPF